MVIAAQARRRVGGDRPRPVPMAGWVNKGPHVGLADFHINRRVPLVDRGTGGESGGRSAERGDAGGLPSADLRHGAPAAAGREAARRVRLRTGEATGLSPDGGKGDAERSTETSLHRRSPTDTV